MRAAGMELQCAQLGIDPFHLGKPQIGGCKRGARKRAIRFDGLVDGTDIADSEKREGVGSHVESFYRVADA